jgi:cell division protein FtsW
MTKLSLDKYLLLTIFALFLFGMVMVASASIALSEKQAGNWYFFFSKQAVFGVFSILLATGVLFVPTERWKNIGPTWLIIGIILLILVLIPGIGHVVNGSRRWMKFGPIAIQVSELVKLCGTMYIAQYLCNHGTACRETFFGTIKPLAMLCMMGLLLLMEPDFGATVVMFTTAMGMMFMAGVRMRWFLILIGLAVFAVCCLVILSPYRMARLTGFLHPWVNQYGSGYQLTQSLIAFGRGSFFGLGLGNSLQKLFYLPEAHTDFVLAIIAEELGLVGVLVLLSLFGVLMWRGLTIGRAAHKMQRLFCAYLAYGLSFWLSMQVVVNMGVNIGLLPTKGLTLPFISYGGSSLMVDFMVIGLLLRIDYENKKAFATSLTGSLLHT